MAHMKGNYDEFCNIPYRKLGWRHFQDISRDEHNTDKYNCDDCVSSDLRASHKKTTKSRSKKSYKSTEQRNKEDEKIRDSRSNSQQKNVGDHDTKKSEQLLESNVHLSFCDQPRREENTYRSTNIKQYSPDRMQVKRVEVIKCWSMNRCQSKYPQHSDEKLLKKNNLKKKVLRKPKLPTTIHLNSSTSSALSSAGGEKYTTSKSVKDDILSRIGKYNNDNKNDRVESKKVVRREKLKDKNFQYCDCLMENSKFSKTKTSSNSKRQRQKCQERIYKRQKSPHQFEEFPKGCEVMRNDNCKNQSWLYDSPCKNQKLCEMLKTREAKRFMGCHCIDSDNRDRYSNTWCLEYPCDFNIINELTRSQQVHNGNSKRTAYRNNNICPSELNSSVTCNCEYPELDNQYIDPKMCPAKQQNIKSSYSLQDTRQVNGKQLEKVSIQQPTTATHSDGIYRDMEGSKKPRETINKCESQHPSDKTISVNHRLSQNNEETSSIRAEDTSMSWQKETVNRIVQCDQQSVSSNLHFDKLTNDPVEAVASLCEKLIMINRKSQQNFHNKPSHTTCRTDRCHCKPVADLSKEEIGSMHNFQNSHNKKSKSRFKRHQFSFPKIIKPNANDGNPDVQKMFICSADTENGSPLSLYKTDSFFKCSIKRNSNEGNKYYVAYVQNYVSPAWKSDDSFETEIKNTEYLSSDDYG